MPGILEKYEFYLDVPDSGIKQAFPFMENLKFRYKKQGTFFRKTISGQIKFYDDSKNNINDFTRVYPMELARRRCEKIRLMVYSVCNETTTLDSEYYFYVADCEWDVSGCSFSVKPEPNDTIQCVIDNWKKDVNILEYGEPTTIRDIYGSIEYETCAGKFIVLPIGSPPPQNILNDDCIDINHGWAELNTTGSQQIAGGNNYAVVIDTTWVREFVAAGTEPPGGGWVAVPGGYARPVDVITVKDPETGIQTRQVASLGEIPNAVLLEEVLINLMREYCPDAQFVSNFFDINPDGNNPTNEYYTKASEEYNECYLIPKSEILFFGATNRATATPTVTLEKLLNDFKVIFDVVLREDWETNILYLEHISFFQQKKMLNLREPVFEFYLKGNYKYKYLTYDIPEVEQFAFADKTDEIGDFDYSKIKYEICSNQEQSESIEQCAVTTTNVVGIVQSGRQDDGKVSADGVVLVATVEKVITRAVGEISQQNIINGTLAMPYLIRNMKTYKRPVIRGEFNGDILTFKRSFPQRQWNGKICMNCTDIQTFDPNHLVNTVLYWGEVEEASYDGMDGVLELTVLHD